MSRVPRDLRAHIFERFVRGEPEGVGGHSAGTGLGLSIARELVEAHGGSIELEETDGTGAAFRFTLPRERMA